MRYTSSHPHAFRNRIAKSVGVLVAAALVAVLGLPTAAQAQNITKIEITGADTMGESLVATWGTRGSDPDSNTFKRWIVTFTEPGTGDDLVLTNTGENAPTDIIDDDGLGTHAGEMGLKTTALTLTAARARVFNDGVWEAQVTACYSVATTADGEAASASNPLRYGVCSGVGMAEAGAAKTYLHGVPMMPMNLEPSMVPGGSRSRGCIRRQTTQTMATRGMSTPWTMRNIWMPATAPK